MRIRSAEKEDFEIIKEIYSCARSFMAEIGNPHQWGDTKWPPDELIKNDIEQGKSYVCLVSNEGFPVSENVKERVAGVFFFDYGEDFDATYRVVADGAWLDDTAYGVVHRIAADGSARGVGEFCIKWAFDETIRLSGGTNGHLRIDTHGDNIVMRNLLNKLGFSHIGTIYVEEDEYPRMAFEKSGLERI